MAILRSEEIQDLSIEEMNEKLAELQAELLRQKSMIASGGAPENPGRIKEIRKTIARILTIKTQKEGVTK
ncbi:MAG: 50S ribosomal protein L29 [Methanobacteriota archaeon]